MARITGGPVDTIYTTDGTGILEEWEDFQEGAEVVAAEGAFADVPGGSDPQPDTSKSRVGKDGQVHEGGAGAGPGSPRQSRAPP